MHIFKGKKSKKSLKKSKKIQLLNMFYSIAVNLTGILVGFFAQKIFLSILNVDYLGLNGLFTNIISMLAIFELGIGSAITFSLYKPIAQNDKNTIKALMAFYKKAYRLVALIVGVVGVALAPFISSFIKEVTVDINIYLVYLMFIVDVVFSYFLTYRRSILYADQKNYIINAVHIGYLILMNVAQLAVLAMTKNYFLYLGIKTICRIVENYVLHLIVKKQYGYLDNLDGAVLDKDIEASINQKIRALFFHKIGTFVVLGTDNLIISKFIGLAEVGLYNNYCLLIDAVNRLVSQTITALTPTIGKRLATGKSEKTFESFRKIRFLTFILSCLSACAFALIVQIFVTLWLGADYLLGYCTVIVLAINMFQKNQRSVYTTFKEAAGIYHEDRFIPLIESAVNVVASLVLMQFFGIAGVFMGTIVSGLVLWCYSYPKYVYKKLFKRSYFKYFLETFGYIFAFLVCLILVCLFGSLIKIL